MQIALENFSCSLNNGEKEVVDEIYILCEKEDIRFNKL